MQEYRIDSLSFDFELMTFENDKEAIAFAFNHEADCYKLINDEYIKIYEVVW